MRRDARILIAAAALAAVLGTAACLQTASAVGQILSSVAAIIDYSLGFNRQRMTQRDAPQNRVATVCTTEIGQCPLASPEIEGLICQCTTDKGNRVDGKTKKPGI
ncbi:MAG: hypothetical protein FJX53_07010 [Alphaproteobacteria bacterium]|nr:hypothetical protein [Alphaproteobacteria bacterium]